MVRKIIRIDEEKCNGCGICANACHEGAIDIIDGKAKLVRAAWKWQQRKPFRQAENSFPGRW